MPLPKIILYYGFLPITDPKAVVLWQRTLAQSLNLTGRILISPHGINGTLGGEMSDLKRYIRATKQYPGMNRIDFKWSEGTGFDFPRLSVKARREIVTFGAPDEIHVTEDGIVGGGIHLKPHQVKEFVQENPDTIFFDGRNAYEAKVGRFVDAVVPAVETTRDFIGQIESGVFDHLKNRPVITYCTGGIRCEVLSLLMKNRGFNEVYQIEGGIARYAEKQASDDLWQGSLYVFDSRMTVDFPGTKNSVGHCDLCATPTVTYFNITSDGKRTLALLCAECAVTRENFLVEHPTYDTEIAG
jgi:UPF0176 protein